MGTCGGKAGHLPREAPVPLGRGVWHKPVVNFGIEEHILLILGVIKESGAKQKGLIEIPSLSEEKGVDGTEVRYLIEFLSFFLKIKLQTLDI